MASHAEWLWASGITKLHVLPALRAAMTNGAAFSVKFVQFRQVLGMLPWTMLGPFCTAIAMLGFIFTLPSRSRALLWGWLAGSLLYVYIVVTVERDDYYMYLLRPLAALAGAAFITRVANALLSSRISPVVRYGLASVCAVIFGLALFQNRAIVRPYYVYAKPVYRNAISLDRTLDKHTLIVMGHYDPSVLYYIGRYGWEEDPYLWTPFDEQSAIAKGARYFVSIEKNRFNRNLELCAWMQRFPIINPNAQWIVYRTDPLDIKPHAQTDWGGFRQAESAGHGRAWLTARGECL